MLQWILSVNHETPMSYVFLAHIQQFFHSSQLYGKKNIILNLKYKF